MASQHNTSTAESDSHDPSIAIICALHMEVAPLIEKGRQIKADSGNGLTFRGCVFDGVRVCIAEGGTGLKRAREATQAVIDAFHPKWIISVGFSGALVDGLNVGDLVVANSVVDQNGEQPYQISSQMPADPERGRHVGRLCTTDHIVHTVAEKRTLAASTNAIAVDMESWAVADVCSRHQTGFFAVRAISDDVHSDLPKEVLAILGPKGTIRAGALVGSLIKRPGSAKDLWAMRERAMTAAEHLGTFLTGVIQQLGESR